MIDGIKHLSTKTILIIILVVIVAGCSGFYYFNKVKPYNDLLTAANKAVTTEDYDNAIKFYTEAETYKKTSDVDKKIQLMSVLKKSKENYEGAVQKMKSKDYLSAINIFKKVDKQDPKRYSDSQNKINECKKLYVSDNLAKAKDDIKNNKFDEASICLNNIFKLDANNSDAKKLEGDIADGQKKKDQTEAAEASTGVPSASGSVTFDQALSMVLKAEFPDGKYAVIKNDDGTNLYASLDSTAVIKNEVKCMADYRGKTISYDSKESKPIEAYFNSNSSTTKNGYEFYLTLGGHTRDGYYVEASTGKLYKHDMGNVHSIN
ncbi:lipopolysaccharide assembly protein LapB [Clostridium sp. 001]|uniref:tetratricopeptide repeat protein n=1 Tax=Clostridium sp. 001 TaxID=1970093 RepID=UPI001C2C0AB9|nr:hypothetical protein [Clostridium sp. 001]QXE17736.1 hypothetical protein B5S50_02090 [Clostridium sp. 001]